MRGCSCRGTAGFVHVSCLAEQAKILWAEAEENNLGFKVMTERWERWHMCSLCEQRYHGVVACALGWACWKTYVGRPETSMARGLAMSLLGNGLSDAGHDEDALSVREADLAMRLRIGAPERCLLLAQSNLANTYQRLGRLDEALSIRQDAYFGTLRLEGEESRNTFLEANNYAADLRCLERFEEVKRLLRKLRPVARRVLGDNDRLTLKMSWNYATALYMDDGATVDDLREAVTTLEDTDRIARRVLGGTHPVTRSIENSLKVARFTLASFDAP